MRNILFPVNNIRLFVAGTSGLLKSGITEYPEHYMQLNK